VHFTNRQFLFTHFFDHPVLGIHDRQINGKTAIQAVCGAAQSGVVGAYGHLHSVQDALIILARFD
jgi:hypothetical protein